jgi:manganese/zinc/iron transport system permease protein
VAGLVFVVFLVLFKELAVLSFDERFAAASGWPVGRLDLILLALVTVVTVIGLQSVGLLLVVAMLILPPAAARFWTDALRPMTAISATIGGLSAVMGVVLSALFPRLAAGAIIVLSGTVLFLVSLLMGARRGVFVRALAFWRLRAKVGRHHILRALLECLETVCEPSSNPLEVFSQHEVTARALQQNRNWSAGRLESLLATAQREGLVVRTDTDGFRLTRAGAEEACRVVRNHRLWELYLIEYADIDPTHVDRDADDIEHLLGGEVIAELERLLAERHPTQLVPPSPHELQPPPVS